MPRPIGSCSVSAIGSKTRARLRRGDRRSPQLPFAGIIELRVPESGARFSADWTHPRLTPAGIEISDAAARTRYEANFQKLVDGLRPVLAGCREVYTHSPWGEYGHTEHIQVYRAVTALQSELGYTIWFPNYVGAASWVLARQSSRLSCWTERRNVAPDLATARKAMRVYRRSGAWTWTPWHRWPAHETLYAQPHPRRSCGPASVGRRMAVGCRGTPMVAAAMARGAATAGLSQVGASPQTPLGPGGPNPVT